MESPQQAAAELQHALTNRIREHLLEENITLKAFTERNDLPEGLGYDRLQRISRGETMLSLTDLMFWAARIPGFGDFVGATVDRVASFEEASAE